MRRWVVAEAHLVVAFRQNLPVPHDHAANGIGARPMVALAGHRHGPVHEILVRAHGGRASAARSGHRPSQADFAMISSATLRGTGS
jgi:hypothetical protein